MKSKIFLLFIISLFCVGVMAQSIQKGPYTISVIADNVFHIEDSNDSNPAGYHYDAAGNSTGTNNCSDMYLVIGKEKALLIDLSNKITWDDTADESLRSLVYERANGKQLYITVTHNHGDHLGMLPVFADDEKAMFWLPKKEFESVDRFPSERTTYFPENESLDLGGFLINTLEVPGHTAHSTLFFLKDRNIVFSGDAIGSGNGVWLFNAESFPVYVEGVKNLIQYIESPANNIDLEKLTVYGGHAWQKGDLDRLNAQYIYDMRTLIDEIGEGTAYVEDYAATFPFLNANFKYGTAIITWNKEAAKEYAESLR